MRSLSAKCTTPFHLDTQGGAGGNDEVQTVTLSNATGGTFRLALDGYVTAPLAYNATAADVDTALESLGSVDQVTVTGAAGGPWTVTFGGTQSGTNVARLDGDVSEATAGTLERTLSYAYDGELKAQYVYRAAPEIVRPFVSRLLFLF